MGRPRPEPTPTASDEGGTRPWQPPKPTPYPDDLKAPQGTPGRIPDCRRHPKRPLGNTTLRRPNHQRFFPYPQQAFQLPKQSTRKVTAMLPQCPYNVRHCTLGCFARIVLGQVRDYCLGITRDSRYPRDPRDLTGSRGSRQISRMLGGAADSV